MYDFPKLLLRSGNIWSTTSHAHSPGSISTPMALANWAIDLSNLDGGAINTSRLFINEASSDVGIEYRAHVIPGRYDVHLFWSESAETAINSLGQGVRLYSVYLNEEKVLCNWSAAAAAGIGTGDPRIACAAALDKAATRAFQLDVNGLEGEDYGVLRI